MSPTSLLDTPLTLIQSQQAAALDDLLRFIVVNDGCRWDALEKRISKVSYEGIFEVALKRAEAHGSNMYSDNSDNMTLLDTLRLGYPMQCFTTTWKAQATDDWAHTTLLQIPAPLPAPASSSSTSSSPHAKKVTRITASCGIKTTHAGNPMKALNIIALDLDDDVPYHAYVEAGFGAGCMIQMEKYGGWKLVLGPGTAIRKACSACWNCKAVSSDSPAYTTPILLCEGAWQGDELFMAMGQVEDDSWQCPRPDHSDRSARWVNRRQPSDCLVTINDMSVWAHKYLSRREQASDSCQPSQPQVSKPTSRAPAQPPGNLGSQSAARSLPSRIILKLPSHIRSIPLRTRKLDFAVHRLIIRSHVLIKAQRITRAVQRRLEDAKLEIRQVNLEAEKKRVEWSLAVARESRSHKALIQARETIKDKRKTLAELRIKDEARQTLAEEAVKKLEVAEKDAGSLKTELKKERQKVSDLVLRNNSLEAQVQIAAENIHFAQRVGTRGGRRWTSGSASGRDGDARERDKRTTEALKETWRVKEEGWKGRIQDLGKERAAVEGHYQQEINNRHQQAQDFISRLQQEIYMLRSQPAGLQGPNIALDQANATIADLRADLDVAWASVREKTSEVNRLNREIGRHAAAMPPGVAGSRSQSAHPVAQGLQLRYTHIPTNIAAFPVPISMPTQSQSQATYLPSAYTVPTPPRTASPANSRRSFSPGELTIGTTRMGVWVGESLEEVRAVKQVRKDEEAIIK